MTSETAWESEVGALIQQAENEEQDVNGIKTYQQALDRLQGSAARSSFATQILTAMGELCFHGGDAESAIDYFGRAVACEGGLGLSHIHLRLGQLRFNRGEMVTARDELLRAYMGSGELVFEFEDPKYLALIKDLVEKA